jgi:hypothetical protein
MACHHLGRGAEARAAWARAMEVPRELPQRESNDLGQYWLDVLIGDILRRECAEVLRDATFPSDPFAR